MWQHLINVVLGLVLVIVALGALGIGALVPFLAGTFSFLGAVIAVFSLWGCFDRMEKGSPLESGVESNM